MFKLFMEKGPPAFVGGPSPREFPINIFHAGIAGPTSVTLDRTERQLLATIYSIENAFIDAVKHLTELLAGKKLDPSKFEKAVGRFGGAMKDYDDFDQTSNKHRI